MVNNATSNQQFTTVGQFKNLPDGTKTHLTALLIQIYGKGMWKFEIYKSGQW
jgi:hypothetical protein